MFPYRPPLALKIDSFRKSDETCASSVYVLTHAHTDHSRMPKTFACPVHCSRATKLLMAPHNPRVRSVDDLEEGQWARLAPALYGPGDNGGERDDDGGGNGGGLRVFCFDSGHCLGGVGLYCPELGLLHFGEGRPARRHLAQLAGALLAFPAAAGGPAAMGLRVVCDDHMQPGSAMALAAGGRRMPTAAQTRRVLAALIAEAAGRGAAVVLRLAHFAVLSALPRRAGQGYAWLGPAPASRAVGARICYDAFKLMRFAPSGDVFVCKAREAEEKVAFHAEGEADGDGAGNRPAAGRTTVNVLLSARWWLHQTPVPDLSRPLFDPAAGAVRVFACSHASPLELARSFLGQCAAVPGLGAMS